MNAELELLWNAAEKKVSAVVADLQARGVQPLPESFTPIGSFAHDDPYGHAVARSELLHGSWSNRPDGQYDEATRELPVWVVSDVFHHRVEYRSIKLSSEKFCEQSAWFVPASPAPRAQFLLITA